MRTPLPNRIETLFSRGKDSSRSRAIADSVPFYSFSATEERKVNTQLAARSTEQVIAAIQALDLDPIKFKLMDPEEGQGWSREYVNQMAIEYKRFLTLSVKYPEETIAPSKDVDKFWHGHILDTMKYAEDCQNVFGHFLHHFPYFGMRGEEDAANLAEAGRTTKRLYEEEFAETISSRASMCSVTVTKGDVAMCSVAIQSKPAMCSVAVTKDDVAMCSVAIQSRPAMCSVAVTKGDVAMCSVAIQSRPAMCSVAVTRNDIAMYAVANQENSLISLSSARKSDSRNILNTSVRPRLALAA